MADVDLMSENGMEYIKVTIPQSTAPVSFKGKFYYRSGSTLQELNGIAAHDFWDDIPEVKTQDMIGGDLIRMADRVIEVLDHKYLVRPIHYEGMRRIEPLEIPTYENSCECAVATIKRENFIKMKAGINDTKVDTKNSTNPNLEELTERQHFIYNFISDKNSEDGTQTAKSLTPKLGVSISTVKRELKELQIKGYLEHLGPSNGGYWKVLIKK